MAKDFFFFIDANQQASSPSAYINGQAAAGAYGPVVPPTTANTDEYRVTSLHSATGFDPTAYAACDAQICVQRVDAA